jgi:hypothetical protein
MVLHPPSWQTRRNSAGNGRNGISGQTMSVEATVMAIPHINKIKVLAKISPALSPPHPIRSIQSVGITAAFPYYEQFSLSEL